MAQYQNTQDPYLNTQDYHSTLADKAIQQQQAQQSVRTQLSEYTGGISGLGSSNQANFGENICRQSKASAAKKVGLKGEASILRERSEVLVKHIVDLTRVLFKPSPSEGQCSVSTKDIPDTVEGDLIEAIHNMDEAIAGAETILSKIGGR